MDLPIKISPSAYREIKQIFDAQKVPQGYLLRVGMKGGGCGASYLIGFDTPKENDLIFDYEQIKLLIDKRQIMYLFDVTLSFEERDDEQGFIFEKSILANNSQND